MLVAERTGVITPQPADAPFWLTLGLLVALIGCYLWRPARAWPLAPRIAAEAAGFQALQVIGPERVLVMTAVIEPFPGVDAGIVQVVEAQPHGIGADRLDADDADMAPAGHQGLLSRAMALDLGRGTFNAQEFRREAELLAIGEADFKPLVGRDVAQFRAGRAAGALIGRILVHVAAMLRLRHGPACRPAGAPRRPA